MTGAVARRVAVPHSLSLAWHVGRVLLAAAAAKADPVEALLGVYGGQARLLMVRRAASAGCVIGCACCLVCIA